MHLICWIVTLVFPFCIFDIILRNMDRTPPVWVGDVMAASLVLLGIALFRHGVLTSRTKKTNSKKPSPMELPGPSPIEPGIEHALPGLFHEMRNYSCSLKGNVSLLLQQTLPESMVIPLKRLERITEKIETITREFLEVTSEQRAAKLKPLDIVELVQGCIAENCYAYRNSIKIERDIKVPIILGDFLKLDRIFLNLFRNAIEAGAGKIHVRFITKEMLLFILVEDDGSGVKEEDLVNLFQPFFTTKKRMGGTGLGLYMVKAIVESHQGSIKAASKRDAGFGETGMIFSIKLPLPKKQIALFKGHNPIKFPVNSRKVSIAIPA